MSIFDDPSILKVADNIYQVLAPNNGQFPHCHGFLFTGSRNIFLDAGVDENFLRRINNEAGIDTLLISHSHPDHIWKWRTLSDRELVIPRETPDLCFDLQSLGERYVGSMERGRIWVELIAGRFGITALRRPDARYSDGDIFDTGTLRIEAVYAPGHLDDHYCFFEHNTGTLFSTDIYFTSFGPWYGNPAGNIREYRESVRRIMALPYRRVCTSHKLPLEGDATAQFNEHIDLFNVHSARIYSALGGGKTLHDLTISSPLYNNRFLDIKIQYMFEEHMILENLAGLIEEGRVREEGGFYYQVKG